MWQYDEMKFHGVDFSKMNEVTAYDNMHKKFRDMLRRARRSSDGYP